MLMVGEDAAETITFGSMLSQIRSVAYRLEREHIAFGDRVAIIGENHPNWAIAYLGIIYRGAVVTPLDPAATIQSLARFLEDAEARLAFVSPASLEKFRAACDQIGRNIPAVALKPLSVPDGLGRFVDWAETPRPADFDAIPPPAQPHDLAILLYTSGTTGVPKAVQLTHGNIYAETEEVQDVMHISDQEVVFSLLPLFHAYSQIVNLWLAATIGARVVYISELSSTEIERGLKQSGATALVGVPRLWYLFHKKIFDEVNAATWPLKTLAQLMLFLNGWLRDAIGLNAGHIFFRRVHQAFGGRLRLAVSAGASFDQHVARDFHRLGFTILQGYGLSETSGAATVTRFEDNKIGSVGKPLKGIEVKIDQPNDEGIGEVLIRGPIVMPGYYHNPQANEQAFTSDGWFRSGDLGRFDKQGHLYIVGRMKDIVKLPSGKNVFPEDVEAHYERSPFVKEVCVLGIKDEGSAFQGAEKLCAVVVPDFDYLRDQHIVNAREWIVWEMENLGRELPEYQRVHDFVLRAEPLPRTTTRKVRRFELKNQLEATTEQRHDEKELVLTDRDRELIDSVAGQALIKAINRHSKDISVVHPQMNLEIDLGLDSLARAECITSVEQKLGVELKPQEITAAQTVADVINIFNEKTGGVVLTGGTEGGLREFRWHELLTSASSDIPEVQPLLKRKRALALVVYLLLKVTYLLARIVFRMEVRGVEVLDRLEPPYLICPNHQSYIDPVLVCSVYPRKVVEKTFHVGASMYFKSPLMAWLARSINVVPIDPDLQLLKAMRAGAVGLRAGKILNIYPEGQRSFDGELVDFKKGAAILALELNLPIVPVALDGVFRILPRKSWRLRAAKVKLRFGEPLNARHIAGSATNPEVVYQHVTAELKNSIQLMLNQLRAEK